MAPRKNAAGVDAPLTVDGGKTAPAPETSTLATDPLPTVRVNNVNLGEIKSALDDVVKQVSGAVASPHPRLPVPVRHTDQASRSSADG